MQASPKRTNIRKLVLSALFLAVSLLLPLLTGQIPEIGKMLTPMHLPVLLCGYVCGWPWGLAVGFVAPLLRFAIFQMPPLMPTGLAMAFELAAYGAISGILYRLLPKKLPWLYLSLVAAMLGGRAVWGLVSIPLYVADGQSLTWAVFLSAVFFNSLPGIVCQLVLIPPIVAVLQRAGVMKKT